MECKHLYYKVVDGKLVCSQCGKPSPKQTIEDKMLKEHETKMWTPETTRITGKRGRLLKK